MWGLFLILALMIPLLAVVLDSQLGRALARRLEGPSGDPARLAALEAEVDRLATEVARLRDQTEFVSRLLEERAEERAEDRLPPGRERG